jgi:hypothetical protein
MTRQHAWIALREVALAAIVAAALGAPAGAQQGAGTEGGSAPAADPAPAQKPAPDAASGEKPAPPPVPQAAPEQKPEPPPAPQAAPEQKPVQEAAPERKPAPAAETAGERKPIIGAAPPRTKKKDEPDRIRGRLARVEGAAIWVQTADGKTLQLKFSETHTTVFSLTKGSYTDVTFGTYVGAVSEKLGDEIYSPIRRDSLSWLHKGYELRIIDEDLRGIALGHQEWDLTGTSVMTHGWVDDQEDRVLSIKYGPTDYDETDVEVPRDAPVLKMTRADKNLVKAGARVFVGARKEADGSYAALFIFVGKDGIVPPL